MKLTTLAISLFRPGCPRANICQQKLLLFLLHSPSFFFFFPQLSLVTKSTSFCHVIVSCYLCVNFSSCQIWHHTVQSFKSFFFFFFFFFLDFMKCLTPLLSISEEKVLKRFAEKRFSDVPTLYTGQHTLNLRCNKPTIMTSFIYLNCLRVY